MQTIENNQPEQMKMNFKPMTKFQKIALLSIASGLALFALAGIIFGPNDVGAYGKEDLIEQIRDKKQNYAEGRLIDEAGKELEAQLTQNAIKQILLEIESAEDPSLIDVDARVQALSFGEGTR